MLEQDWKETRESKSKINLSDEGVEAFLEFLNGSKTNVPQENPGVFVELLEISHEMEIPTLEKAMKKIMLGKPDDWLDFDQALRLLILSTKVDDYEDVKRKALNSMKL